MLSLFSCINLLHRIITNSCIFYKYSTKQKRVTHISIYVSNNAIFIYI